METNNIKDLIQAFYDGKTTVEEEKIIFDYFQNEGISEDLEEEKKFFLSLQAIKKPIDIPSSLESKISKLIDNLDQNENKKSQKIKNLWIWIASSAACIIIVLSVGFYLNENRTNYQMAVETKDTFDDPNQAYKEVEQALILVSNNMNKGIEQLSVISSNMDKTSDIFNKSINKINEKES